MPCNLRCSYRVDTSGSRVPRQKGRPRGFVCLESWRRGDALKIAVLFPGQGSQFAGMADVWMEHPAGRAVLDEASGILGYDIVERSRDEKGLGDTAVVQPALFACDLAAFRVLESEGVQFHMTAGHSLGEFAALVAAGALAFRPALEAVVERGQAMHDAAEEAPGAMTALLGLSPTMPRLSARRPAEETSSPWPTRTAPSKPSCRGRSQPSSGRRSLRGAGEQRPFASTSREAFTPRSCREPCPGSVALWPD
jgi:hypothetical protein